MAKILFDEKFLEAGDQSFDEPIETQEIIDAIKALNRSVAQINRAVVKLQQKMINRQAALESEAVKIVQTIH
ncbi:hypothetical protein SAMN02745866_02964 [Alteromonadaceae bacterium Bs31]|nr:hypothetical protein SAMN02745866_02964 [Alteromonadaceae bacterium Bs31]